MISLILACCGWLTDSVAVIAVENAPAIVESAPAEATPVRLLIPRIKLDTAVESVGKTDEGEMDVPQAPQNVAWYNLGVAPGEPGNAVISGHLDDKAGRAVFWRLRELKVDDVITVVDQAGVEREFVVIERAIYPYDKAPIHKIFGFDIERDLNLITCTGRWNKKAKTYDKRLVLYTRLIQE